MTSKRARWLRRAVILVVVLVAAYGLPALWPEVRTALAGVANIAPAVLLGALALETASLACFSGLTVSLIGRARRPRFFTLLRIDVTVYGLSRVLPAAAATGGALRLRLLTAAGVTHPDAVFLATIEGTGSALLLWVMLGATLVVALPVNGADPRQILLAAAGIVLVAAAFALLVAVARDGRGLRRLTAWLALWVPGMNADTASAGLRREGEHLRALAADPPRLAAAVAWGAANWLLDAAVLWLVLAAVGHPLDPLTLFTAYAVANVLGLLPITPGGVGVVEGVLIPSLVAAGVPAHLALVGVLGWRLVNYWLPIPVAALLWLTLPHHPTRPGPADDDDRSVVPRGAAEAQRRDEEEDAAEQRVGGHGDYRGPGSERLHDERRARHHGKGPADDHRPLSAQPASAHRDAELENTGDDRPGAPHP